MTAPQGQNRPVLATWTTQSTSTSTRISPSCMKAPLEQRVEFLGRYLEMIDQPREQATAVGPAHCGFDVIFRMRHHPKHIPALVDDTGDAVHRAVVIPVRIDHAVGRRIAEQHSALALEPGDGLPVGDVISL